MNEPCDCTQPGYCPHFRRVLQGTDWRLSRLRNHLGSLLRGKWAREADEAAKRSAPPAPRGPCKHMGRRVRLEGGGVERRQCLG